MSVQAKVRQISAAADLLLKPDVAYLEKLFAESPSLDNGSGGFGDKSGGLKGYGGGGDGGDGNGGKGEGEEEEFDDGNKNVLTADEKYVLKSQFANQCLEYNLPYKFISARSDTSKMTDL